MVGKNYILIICLSFVLFGSGYQDKKACRTFNNNLKIIKYAIDKRKGQNLGRVSPAIDFFEQITGIFSHSDGNYFGRFSPTKEDYENWRNWYNKNKLKLYWDSKEHKVKVLDIP